MEVFLSDLSNVYEVKLSRSFDSYVLPSKLLSKLQEKYGNWTDSYKYCCQKSNKIGSERLIDDPAHKDCEGTYNVLWATKFDLLKTISKYVDYLLINNTKSLENSSPKDMLFEVLMARFDILELNRRPFLEIYKILKKNPQQFIKLLQLLFKEFYII